METDVELNPQESGSDLSDTRTRPSTRHQGMTCKLSERGVKAGDSRLLSEVADRITLGDSIEWAVFERGIGLKLRLEYIKSIRRAFSLLYYNIHLL